MKNHTHHVMQSEHNRRFPSCSNPNLVHITANLAEHLHVFRSYMLSRSLLLCPVSGSLHELSTSQSSSAIGSSYDNGGTGVLTIMNIFIIIIIIIIPLSLPLHFRRGRRRAAFVPWVQISSLPALRSMVPHTLALGFHLRPFHTDRNTHHARCP